MEGLMVGIGLICPVEGSRKWNTNLRYEDPMTFVVEDVDTDVILISLLKNPLLGRTYAELCRMGDVGLVAGSSGCWGVEWGVLRFVLGSSCRDRVGETYDSLGFYTKTNYTLFSMLKCQTIHFKNTMLNTYHNFL